jgi:integrase
MAKHRKRSNVRCTRRVLRIPDLEQSKHAVLNSLPAKTSQESYGHAIDEFISWYCSEPRRAGILNLAPHDLRRTCARLCHLAGGELEQIQFLLGHVSVQKTERYLGCKQKLRHAVNDKLGLDGV